MKTETKRVGAAAPGGALQASVMCAIHRIPVHSAPDGHMSVRLIDAEDAIKAALRAVAEQPAAALTVMELDRVEGALKNVAQFGEHTLIYGSTLHEVLKRLASPPAPQPTAAPAAPATGEKPRE